jgi:hypothetical protein
MLVAPVLLTGPPDAVTEITPLPETGAEKYASTHVESPAATVTLDVEAEQRQNPPVQFIETSYWPVNVPVFTTQ